MIDGNTFAFLLFLFVQFLLQRVARGVAVADFFHAQRGDAAATAFDGAFGKNIADRHAEDDEEEEAEGEEQLLICVANSISKICFLLWFSLFLILLT